MPNASYTISANVWRSIRYYLSERFRLRFEDAGIEDMMEEESEQVAEAVSTTFDDKVADDEAVDVTLPANGDIAAIESQINQGTIRTLDGELAGDELEGDAINYQILLGKIDALLDRLKLDA